MKRILVTGGSGFVGRRLVAALQSRGDLVTVLTRNCKHARKRVPQGVRLAAWQPDTPGPWVSELEVVDAVVHLAGEGIAAKRWTDEQKKRIEQSRVQSTEQLVRAIGAAKHKPSVLVSASAVGYYGPHAADEVVDEESAAGKDFLATVVARWEQAARGAEEHGVRVVRMRSGIVLGKGGGALEPMVLPFKLFVGGPIGHGNQVYSWIHRDDLVALILRAIDDETVSGPINAVAPNAVTSREMAEAIGTVLNRSSWLPAPEALLRLRLGEGADFLLTGQRVAPRRATELGFQFRFPRLVPALESIIAPEY